MMRAAQFEKGGPENLYVAEVARPVLGEGQVLIRVHATAINRADTLQVSGSNGWYGVISNYSVATQNLYMCCINGLNHINIDIRSSSWRYKGYL